MANTWWQVRMSQNSYMYPTCWPFFNFSFFYLQCPHANLYLPCEGTFKHHLQCHSIQVPLKGYKGWIQGGVGGGSVQEAWGKEVSFPRWQEAGGMGKNMCRSHQERERQKFSPPVALPGNNGVFICVAHPKNWTINTESLPRMATMILKNKTQSHDVC